MPSSPGILVLQVVFVELLETRRLSLSTEVLDDDDEERGGEEHQDEHDVNNREGVLRRRLLDLSAGCILPLQQRPQLLNDSAGVILTSILYNLLYKVPEKSEVLRQELHSAVSRVHAEGKVSKAAAGEKAESTGAPDRYSDEGGTYCALQGLAISVGCAYSYGSWAQVTPPQHTLRAS